MRSRSQLLSRLFLDQHNKWLHSTNRSLPTLSWRNDGNTGVWPFEINHTLSIHIQLRRKRGVGVFPQVSLVRIGRTHSH